VSEYLIQATVRGEVVYQKRTRSVKQASRYSAQALAQVARHRGCVVVLMDGKEIPLADLRLLVYGTPPEYLNL
jgi:hypothetical protein